MARGRPRYKPNEETRRIVETMAGCGVPQVDIAMALRISQPTLIRHFRHELDVGHIKANAAVAQSLYKTAIKGGREGTQAAIFWLRCRAGWSEYAPPPAPRAQPLGKKEQALAAAETAADGTEWADLVH